jgi:hypothetical protein
MEYKRSHRGWLDRQARISLHRSSVALRTIGRVVAGGNLGGPCILGLAPTADSARSRLPRRSPRSEAGNSCCMPKRCTATPTTATRLLPSSRYRKLTGVAVRRIHGDKGYRGHNYPERFNVSISGRFAGSPKPSAARCDAEPRAQEFEVAPGRKAFRWRHRTRAIEIKDLERVAVDHCAIGCAVAISSAATATASTPISPPLDIISTCSSAGSRSFYAPRS